MNSEETKTILSLLVQLAKADGIIDLKEDLFIKLYAHNNSVDPGEFDRICRSPEMYSRGLSSISDKEGLFAQLCSFIHFDMNVAETELDWCKNIGQQLYLDRDRIDLVLNTIRDSSSPMSVDELGVLIKG